MSNTTIAAALHRTRARRRITETAPAGSAAAYLRVSVETKDKDKAEAEIRAGIEAQRTAIESVAQRRGWTVSTWYEDIGESGGKAPHLRPGLAAALAAVQGGHAERLIVSKVDRLSRKFRDCVELMETAVDEGWPLYIADIDADLTTSNGRLLARMLAVLAEEERDRIRQRTKAALAEKRAAGVRLGRRSVLPASVVGRIVAERDAGAGWKRIADGLNADGVATGQGGARWYAASVRVVANGQDAALLRAGVSA